MKRAFSCIMIFALLFSIFGGALAESQSASIKALLIAPTSIGMIEEQPWIKRMANEAGVRIRWEQMSEAAWERVKESRLSSGDVPDLLFHAITPEDAAAHPDLLLELSIPIFRYAPLTENFFAQEPDALALVSNADGDVYFLPGLNGRGLSTAGVMYINQAWLTKLGLGIPTTLRGLEKALLAFKENDCNDNEDPDDEIPLDFNGWFGSPLSVTQLIGSWGIQLTNSGADGFFAEDGQVKNYAADSRYGAMMAFLAGLYNQGLICPDALNGDLEAYSARSKGTEEGRALVGVAFGREAVEQFGPELAGQYAPFGPLEDDYDFGAMSQPRWSYDFSGLNFSGPCAAVSAACAHPEAALAFLDQFYNPEYAARIQASAFADYLPYYIPRTDTAALSREMTLLLRDRQQYREVLARIDMMLEYYPQFLMHYSPETEETQAQLLSQVNEVTAHWWPLWLTGQADVQSTWTEYIGQLQAAGLPQLLALRQMAYNAFGGQ